MIGNEIHLFCKKIWGINRSITGDGVRETLKKVKEICPELEIKELASGTKVFDWVVPKEWSVKEAWIKSPDGEIICNFSENNLHLVGYSVPIKKHVSLSELNQHLHSLEDMPHAIPYVTSYYNDYWGFCIEDTKKKKLKNGIYEVNIDSQLFDGSLSYGEILLKGRSNKEVFLSTYICHPSMANNELSGIGVLTYIAKYISQLKNRKYTYRIIFIPETIGSLSYLSLNLEEMKKNIFVGFNVTCIGDNRTYSYLPSRDGNTYSDLVARHVLSHLNKNFITYSWNDRGSDERQYCAPGIDLPIASIMRSKYGEYDEYHTSLDNLTDVVTPEGLDGGYQALFRSLEVIERDAIPKTLILGEPQMGKRGLYPTVSKAQRNKKIKNMMNIISYSDGKNSILEIAQLCNVPVWEIYEIIDLLIDRSIIEIKELIRE